MSELAIASAGDRDGGAFRPATMVAIVAIGIFAFAATLVLGAYAPDFRTGRNGGSHALSNAATGFAGLVQLARATGRNPRIVRSTGQLGGEELVVLTPETGTADLGRPLDIRAAKPTLVILSKWNTVADPRHPGWVRSMGLKPIWDPERTLAPKWALKIDRRPTAGLTLRTAPDYSGLPLRFTAPEILQTVSGPGVVPIVVDDAGAAVVAQLNGQALYVLADPDLLSNAGMARLSQAESALNLLDDLNSTGSRSISFDVTLNGFGRSANPLKLLFDPPFLATTLALAAALLLAGIHAAIRFGAPRRPVRAIAFGKAALVDNAAALVRKARREAALGARYAQVVRERAISAFGVPVRLKEEEIDGYLDALGVRKFSALAQIAGEARSREELVRAARALHDWQGEIER
jgi:hypothetical protein